MLLNMTWTALQNSPKKSRARDSVALTDGMINLPFIDSRRFVHNHHLGILSLGSLALVHVDTRTYPFVI